MKKVILYLEESYKELVHKVTWPSWKELQGSAILVMVSSMMIAIVVALMDYGFKTIMNWVYGIFS